MYSRVPQVSKEHRGRGGVCVAAPSTSRPPNADTDSVGRQLHGDAWLQNNQRQLKGSPWCVGPWAWGGGSRLAL